ncbi:MAG: undecaprenyl diphosphate synthase family protein, partial [Robiginitomaculum sp.]|nr:undecaprenyl diphosphate synthase family protein [Robiginitomaculum sp.]
MHRFRILTKRLGQKKKKLCRFKFVVVDTPTSVNFLPKHVAIVMDGNGRWAQSQGKPRIFGHQAGVETLRKVVGHVAQSGTKHLTLFSFSTENWKRPKEEIKAL